MSTWKQSCPKCGNGLGHGVNQDPAGTFAFVAWDVRAEDLLRVCKRCNYRWHELPLDAAEQTPTRPTPGFAQPDAGSDTK